MRRWWAGAVVSIPLAAAIACGDDDPAVPGSDADAGADAPTYAPTLPPLPLLCTRAGTFDPCDAGLDPSVYGATLADGGVLADSDAGAWSDAGRTAAACVASGAARVACPDDGGAVRFDLAANDDGSSALVAYASLASRFSIDPAGGLSAMTALESYDYDVGIVSGRAGTATIFGQRRNVQVRVRRDGAMHDDSVLLKDRLDDDGVFAGAGIADDGSLTMLLRGGGEDNLITLPSDYDGLHPTTAPGHGASALWLAPSGEWLTAANGVGGFDVYRRSAPVRKAAGADTFVFATVLTSEGRALVAGVHADAIEVYAERADDFVRMRAVREPACGLDQKGCGHTCTERVHRPEGSSGSFVHLANGHDYLVYPEAFVTRERHYSVDHDPACDLLGGCACTSKTDHETLDEVDAVVLEVSASPYRLTERARAHLLLGGTSAEPPATPPVTGLKAVSRGNAIHVLYRGNGREMAHLILDLGK